MDEFTEDSAKDQNNSAGLKKSKKKDILSRMEDKLVTLYDFRFNIISNQLEYKEKNKETFEPINEQEVYRTLFKMLKGITFEKLKILLGSKFVEEYNPILDYFESIRNLYSNNPETDFILEFLDFLKVEDKAYLEETFKFWMVRCIASVFEASTYNKTVFVFYNSQQDSGKTTLARFIVPKNLKPYFVENDIYSKDGFINLYSRMFMLFDEMASMKVSNGSIFKAYISTLVVNIRPPYGKQPISRPRITSFLGTSDQQGFLPEDVGTARFLVHHILKIDWNYSIKCNPDLLWSQALYLYGTNQFNMMSPELKAKVATVNKGFIESTVISEYISEILIASTKEEGEFMQLKDILEYLIQHNKTIRLPTERRIGKALESLGFRRVSVYQKDTKQSKYGFFVQKLSTRK